MSELAHPDARSFERVAELYERRRPEYPREAVSWIAGRLDLRAGRTALVLGAGTGKLTRALVATGSRVIALEPGEAMLAQLRRAVPSAEPLLGAAEAIPLPDAAVDAVACGQSFHWFRAEEALAEIRRVLRAGGGLALIWNIRDQADPLQRQITALLEPFVPPGRLPPSSLADAVERNALFGLLDKRSFPFVQHLDADGLAERVATISFVAAAAPAERAELERALRGLAAARGGEVPFRYVTQAFVTRAA
jgi:ubiquinone/menaquinone biosynthesis C-methylase UbiE